jgi:integrase
MMGREYKGEGKPRKREADGTWVQWLDLGYANGKRIRKKVEAKDRATVMHKVAELRRKHAAGIDITQKPESMAILLKTWLTEDFAPNARRKSIETYNWVLDHCLIPQIGGELPDELNRRHVQGMMAALSREGMSPKTITLARTVLRQALQQAVIDGLLDRNVVTLTKPPKLARSPGKALSREQARALLEAARGERLEVAIRVALSLGLRRGEICGLRWSDIDFTHGTLTVNGTMVYVTGGGLTWGEPKTESGHRTLKLGAKLLAALRWHQTRLAAERSAMGAQWQPSEYVFVSVTNGGPLNPGTLYFAFRRIAARAGLEGYRLHDLRHSCASFLAAQGYTRKQAQEILGHANPQITEALYTHLFPDSVADVGDRIEEYLDDQDAPDERRRSGGE